MVNKWWEMDYNGREVIHIYIYIYILNIPPFISRYTKIYIMYIYLKTSNKKLSRAQDDSLNEMMCRLLKQQSPPEIEIDVSDGNPVEFHYFMAVFREVVKSRCDRGKLTRLIKYTKDVVKNSI